MALTQANAKDLVINVVDVNDKPVKDIVVYAIPNVGVADLPMNPNQLTIDQEGKKFSPYVTVMQKGQAIQFMNKDDITHHIYSVSGNNRFEFKLKAHSMKKTEVMDSAEEVAMGCNIHDWMSGYALVVDTPYYGKTNDDGKVTLNVADAGEYEVTVWHPQLDVKDNRIEKNYTLALESAQFNIKLPKVLLPIPEQLGEDDFDFIEEY